MCILYFDNHGKLQMIDVLDYTKLSILPGIDWVMCFFIIKEHSSYEIHWNRYCITYFMTPQMSSTAFLNCPEIGGGKTFLPLHFYTALNYWQQNLPFTAFLHCSEFIGSKTFLPLHFYTALNLLAAKPSFHCISTLLWNYWQQNLPSTAFLHCSEIVGSKTSLPLHFNTALKLLAAIPSFHSISTLPSTTYLHYPEIVSSKTFLPLHFYTALKLFVRGFAKLPHLQESLCWYEKWSRNIAKRVESNKEWRIQLINGRENSKVAARYYVF